MLKIRTYTRLKPKTNQDLDSRPCYENELLCQQKNHTVRKMNGQKKNHFMNVLWDRNF